MRISFARLLLTLLLVAPAARADFFGGAPACPLNGCTFTGPITAPSATFTGSGTALTVTNNASVGGTLNLAGNMQDALTIDYSALSPPGGASRQIMWSTTLSPSVNTTNIWENDSSFVYLNGPGIANQEINVRHSYLQVNAGATFTTGELYEGSAENLGTMTTNPLTAFEGFFHNTASATAYGFNGLAGYLVNDNTTPGSVGTFALISMGAMQGSGSAPTYDYLIRGGDPKATLAMLGNENIGGLGQPPSTTMLQVDGVDNLSTSTPIYVQNLAGTKLFTVADDGTVQFNGMLVDSTGNITITTPATGTAASYACFTSGGKIISSATAC